MKKALIIFSLLLVAGHAFSQYQWNPQISGTSSYLFDIYFADHYNGWACGTTGLMLNTTDGGETWNEQSAPPNNAYYSVCFTDAQTGWASGYAGKMIHTTDGGNSWTSQNSGSNTFLYDVFFMDENEGWAAGGDHGNYPTFINYREILHTTDGGNTWQVQLSQSHEPLLHDIQFINGNLGFAVGESGRILKTSNGGNDWIEKMADHFYHFYGVSFVNEHTGFVVGEYLGLPHVSTVFSTNDGGETWTNQTFGTDESLLDVYFIDEYNGWAVGGTATSASLLYTNDGGLNWMYSETGSDKALSSVHFLDLNTGWAAGYMGTIIKTNLATGINDSENDEQFSVYPNPAGNYFSVNIPEPSDNRTTLKILNSLGQEVYTNSVGTNTSATAININTSNFVNGFYTVLLENNSRITLQKLIIDK